MPKRCRAAIADIKARAYATASSNLPAKCAVPACGRPTMRAQAKGLASFHCKYHVQFKNRHGSYWRKSYRASELQPYRKAALSYIKRHDDDRYMRHALCSLAAEMEMAGAVELVHRLKGLPPEVRAKQVFARLREKGTPPARLLATYLGIVAVLAEDQSAPRTPEFRLVQIAKSVHRLASGSHQRWPGMKFELHAYSRSSGRMLRHLGRLIEECCEWAAEYHLAGVLALKVKRYGRSPSARIVDPTSTIHLPPEQRSAGEHSSRQQARRAPSTAKPPKPKEIGAIKDASGRVVRRIIRYE